MLLRNHFPVPAVLPIFKKFLLKNTICMIFQRIPLSVKKRKELASNSGVGPLLHASKMVG